MHGNSEDNNTSEQTAENVLNEKDIYSIHILYSEESDIPKANLVCTKTFPLAFMGIENLKITQ